MYIGNYKKAKEYFYGKKNHFWDLGLDNIKEFLKKFDSPQNKLNVIQVAGTNGKGSTSAMISEILKMAGYKIGRYNSPAVFEDRENITINGEPMSESDFEEIVSLMQPVMEEAESEGKLPTVFELETIMAILYFYRKDCDIAVLECGLGGELDATNVSEKNVLSVITSISLDHMGYLGDTEEKIASVKAGIIKKDSWVVIGNNSDEVRDIIKRRAQQKNSRYNEINRSGIKWECAGLSGQKFSYVQSDGERIDDLEIKLLGAHQLENAALAIEAVNSLKKSGYIISEDNIKTGLKNVMWKGRFEIIRENPLVILDGAHNPDAAKRLKESLDLYLSDYEVTAIMGVFADKDYNNIIDIMKDYLKKTVVVKAAGERALAGRCIKEAIEDRNPSAHVKEADSYDEAVKMAYEMSEAKKKAVVAFGSLSYLKYIREAVCNDNRQ